MIGEKGERIVVSNIFTFSLLQYFTNWIEKSFRNKKNIIPSISVTDIVFDDYLGNGIIELFPK